MNILSKIAVIVLLSITHFVYSQVGNSPYTDVELGEQIGDGMTNNYGEGGIGLANPSLFHINIVNPALLSYNKVSSFSLGMGSNYNLVRNKESVQRGFTANLQYLAMAVPIAKKYSISIGLQPFSAVRYKYSSIEKISNSEDLVEIKKQGDEGLNYVFLGQGYQINKKLSVGIKASYVFGVINSYSTSDVVYSGEYMVKKQSSVNYRGILVKPGIAYRTKLKEELFFNAGATYQLPTKFSNSESIISKRVGDNGETLFADTIETMIGEKISYPSSFGIGIGLEKATKWSAGIDFTTQNWSAFKGVTNSTFKDSYSFSLGGEIMPNFYSENFFKRLGLRGGVNFTKSRLYFNEKQLHDKSLSIGTSVPVRGISLLDLSFTAGTRGTTTHNLLSENYYKISIGLTLNDKNWFRRSKYE